MKTGRALPEVLAELKRQEASKRDYISTAPSLSLWDDERTLSMKTSVSQELFAKVCAEAAFDAKRDFQMVARTRQAADHPVALSFPEGLYLKGLLLRSTSAGHSPSSTEIE